jgi:hypothetical protein
MPSPGEPQAEPTIGKAINGGYDLLEANCNRCDRVSLVPLRSLKHPAETPVWKLEAALYCEPCSEGRHYSRRQRAHILGLTYARPDPEQPRMPGRKTGRTPDRPARRKSTFGERDAGGVCGLPGSPAPRLRAFRSA